MVAEVVAVADNIRQVNPIKDNRAQPGPRKELLDRAKAVVTEPAAEVVAVDNLVVQEVLFVVATMVLFLVKMATVWHPTVVLFLVVRMAVGAE